MNTEACGGRPDVYSAYATTILDRNSRPALGVCALFNSSRKVPLGSPQLGYFRNLQLASLE